MLRLQLVIVVTDPQKNKQTSTQTDRDDYNTLRRSFASAQCNNELSGLCTWIATAADQRFRISRPLWRHVLRTVPFYFRARPARAEWGRSSQWSRERSGWAAARGKCEWLFCDASGSMTSHARAARYCDSLGSLRRPAVLLRFGGEGLWAGLLHELSRFF